MRDRFRRWERVFHIVFAVGAMAWVFGAIVIVAVSLLSDPPTGYR